MYCHHSSSIFLGWGDVSWNEETALTPYLHSLARHGLTLRQHYAHPVCSPSRAALMTGYYASRTRLQKAVYPNETIGLDLKFKLLPQYLKDLGYRTYGVGK